MCASTKRRQTLLVSFSGIDGAGKSTQIANLRARLDAAGQRVHLITFWEDVATLTWIREDVGHKLFKGDKGVGTPDSPIERRDKNVRSPVMTLVRLALYVLDAVSLRRTVRRALRTNADVIIFDRYIYDELANLNLRNTAVRLYVRAVMKLVPQPEFSFVLDADPAAAHARKPEYPLDFLHENRTSYLALSRILAGITVIPPLPRERASAEVVRCVLGEPSTSYPQTVAVSPYARPEIARAERQSDGHDARPTTF